MSTQAPEGAPAPYRVRWIKVSADSRHHGWLSETKTFKTESAARSAADEPFERGVKKAKVERYYRKPSQNPNKDTVLATETLAVRKNGGSLREVEP